MILIATIREYPEPTPSGRLLIDALAARGVKAELRIWTETPAETFAAADLVLPICCWDYHRDPASFGRWIDDLDRSGARLANAAETLRWNLRKTYLLQMATDDLPVPATFHLPAPSGDAVESVMRRQGWTTAILKPVIGQSGFGVAKLELASRAEWRLDGRDESLLQEFQADIGALGESTLTFIDGTFSHGVRRNLKPGEWRANLQFGASYEAFHPSPETIAMARRYLDLAPKPPLYARVDGIVRPDGFLLMELELIEPYLYLEFAPGSADRLAEALTARLH